MLPPPYWVGEANHVLMLIKMWFARVAAGSNCCPESKDVNSAEAQVRVCP